MIKFTEAEAKAYFAEKHMTLEWYDWANLWAIKLRGGSMYFQRYATLEGAITGRMSGYGDRRTAAAAFEKWLMQRRMEVQCK